MQTRVIIDKQGMVTIPDPMREALGLTADDELIIEDTEDGILLRPIGQTPVELYTEPRIAEFTRDDPKVASILGLKKDD